MKKKFIFGLLAMVFLGCSNPTSSNSTVDDPLVRRGTINGKSVEITISRTDLSKAAVLTPRVGDFYTIKLAGTIISKGKISSVDNGALTFTPSADSPGPKEPFKGTYSSNGTLSVPSIPYDSGTLSGFSSNSSSTSSSSSSSGGGGGGGGWFAPTPTPNVEMAGTTWRGESDRVDGHYVGTFTFTASNFTLTDTVDGAVVGNGQGTYAVNGNSVTLTWTGSNAGYTATVTISNNTFELNGITFEKQSSDVNTPNPIAKTIVITLGEDACSTFLLAGDVMIMAGNDDIGEGGGIGVINAARTSVAFDLYNFTWDNNEFTPSTRWTGSGSCNMFLQNGVPYGVYYVYSNGHEVDVYDEDAEKISISVATTTIASSKFAEYDQVYDQNIPNAKTLTITGLTAGTPELTAAAKIELYRRIADGDGYSPASTPIAKASAATVNADNSVTFTLIKGWKNEPWKGAGWVFIKVTEGIMEYWYVDHTKLPNPVSTDETFCFTDETGSHSIAMADLYLQP